MKKIIFLLTFILISSPAFAQFEVEFNEMNGELTKNDKYEEGFGRYDGFQIPLYSGETVNFVVYAETFSPKIVFVTPKGNVYRQTASTGNIASIITTVPEDGEWLLYIVGDANAIGKYTLQYALAASNSIKIPTDSDFCTSLNFVIAHAKAYFLLLENSFDSQKPFIKLTNSKDAFIDDADASYNAVFLETNDIKEAEKLYKQLVDQVSVCVDKEWSKNVSGWQKIEDYKVMSTQFKERVKEKERFVNVMLLDLRGSKQKFLNDYTVQIIINRNQ